MFLDAKDTALDRPDVHVRGARDDLERPISPVDTSNSYASTSGMSGALVPGSPRPVPDVGPTKGLEQIGKARRRPWCHRGQGCQRHRHPRPTRRRRHPRGRRHPRNQQSQNRRHHAPAVRRSSCRRARQSQEIVSVGRGLAALPLGDGLTAHAQAGRKSLLRSRAYGAGRRDDGLCPTFMCGSSPLVAAAPRPGSVHAFWPHLRGTQAHWHATTFAVAPGTRHHLWFAFCTAGLREGKQMPATQSCGRWPKHRMAPGQAQPERRPRAAAPIAAAFRPGRGAALRPGRG